jgi:hypothetical protein
MRTPAFILGLVAIAHPIFAQQQVIADPPAARGPFTLSALYDAALGHNAFAYDGKAVPP